MRFTRHTLPILLFCCGTSVGCDRFRGESAFLGAMLENQSDTLSVTPNPPGISISNLSAAFVSAGAGAINTASFDWTSSATGTYSLVLGGTTCTDGSLVTGGTVAAGVSVTGPVLTAASMTLGSNTYRLCVIDSTTNATGMATVDIIRDDTPPLVTPNPGAGNFGAVPSIVLNCSDTGGAGCDGVIYTINALDPAPVIDGVSGTVLSGSLYSNPVALPDATITGLRYRARDRAGNVSGVGSQSYTVDSTVATVTITPASISLASFNSTINGKKLEWSSSKSGPYTIVLGGTDCTNGTPVTGTNVTGAALATATQTTTLSDATAHTADVKVRICVKNLIGNYGYTEVNFKYDVTPPYIVSSTPSPAATGTSTLDDGLTVTFSKPMDTTASPTLTTAILRTSPATYAATPNTPSYSWSADRTVLTVHTGWIRFPENVGIRWALDTPNLKDVAGNTLDISSAPFPRTFQTGADTGTFTLFDTGATDCFDAGGAVISCSDPAYPGQDGAYTTGPAPTYTGPFAPPGYTYDPAQPTVPQDLITTESITGLTWRPCTIGTESYNFACSNGLFTSFTWENAVNACAALNYEHNGAGFAGIRSWRLPTLVELMTVLRYGSNPILDTTSLPRFDLSRVWTSTGTGNNQSASVQGMINFARGMIEGRSNAHYVVCVSGKGNRRTGAPISNHDGTVTDTRTGLMWQKCPVGQTYDLATDTCSGTATSSSWQGALQACDSLTLPDGSYSDWRLPNINELNSLFDAGRTPPYIDTSIFGTPGMTAATMSSTRAFNQQFVPTYFGYGWLGYMTSTVTASVRCVRGP